MTVTSVKITAGQWSMSNSVCDCRKALLNGGHDCQYLDVTTTFANFNTFTTFSKANFAMF